MARIVILPGDGIGPEVAAQAVRVLEAAAARFSLEITIEEALIGGAAYDAVGMPLPEETLAACKAAVKARDRMSPAEMYRLISRLEACRNPHTCPHGRPTSIRIETGELEKRFKRKE